MSNSTENSPKVSVNTEVKPVINNTLVAADEHPNACNQPGSSNIITSSLPSSLESSMQQLNLQEMQQDSIDSASNIDTALDTDQDAELPTQQPHQNYRRQRTQQQKKKVRRGNNQYNAYNSSGNNFRTQRQQQRQQTIQNRNENQQPFQQRRHAERYSTRNPRRSQNATEHMAEEQNYIEQQYTQAPETFPSYQLYPQAPETFPSHQLYPQAPEIYPAYQNFQYQQNTAEWPSLLQPPIMYPNYYAARGTPYFGFPPTFLPTYQPFVTFTPVQNSRSNTNAPEYFSYEFNGVTYFVRANEHTPVSPNTIDENNNKDKDI